MELSLENQILNAAQYTILVIFLTPFVLIALSKLAHCSFPKLVRNMRLSYLYHDSKHCPSHLLRHVPLRLPSCKRKLPLI
jgi:hypothetical protein